MRPMPWYRLSTQLLSDLELHAQQLAGINQSSTLRIALANSRCSARFLIRGARGAQFRNRHEWREIFGALREYRHSVRVYVRALNKLQQPTHAQWMRLPL